MVNIPVIESPEAESQLMRAGVIALSGSFWDSIWGTRNDGTADVPSSAAAYSPPKVTAEKMAHSFSKLPKLLDAFEGIKPLPKSIDFRHFARLVVVELLWVMEKKGSKRVKSNDLRRAFKSAAVRYRVPVHNGPEIDTEALAAFEQWRLLMEAKRLLFLDDPDLELAVHARAFFSSDFVRNVFFPDDCSQAPSSRAVSSERAPSASSAAGVSSEIAPSATSAAGVSSERAPSASSAAGVSSEKASNVPTASLVDLS